MFFFCDEVVASGGGCEFILGAFNFSVGGVVFCFCFLLFCELGRMNGVILFINVGREESYVFVYIVGMFF